MPEQLTPDQKAGLLMAISQLDMFVNAIAQNAPDRVKKAAKEFKESLKEWSKNA